MNTIDLGYLCISYFDFYYIKRQWTKLISDNALRDGIFPQTNANILFIENKFFCLRHVCTAWNILYLKIFDTIWKNVYIKLRFEKLPKELNWNEWIEMKTMKKKFYMYGITFTRYNNLYDFIIENITKSKHL